jgi:bla regulator protein BlaR1
MIPIQLQPLIDHVWQSTFFAVVAGALTLVLRNNRARVRYCLWFAASVKFLVPFSLLAAAGSYFGRHSIVMVLPSRLPVIADRVTESLVVSPSILMTTPASAAFPANLILAPFGLVWTIGFIVLASSWWLRWRRVRAVLRTASRVQLPINLKAMSSPAFMEPGVFGIYDPILLLPEGITEKLTPLEFEAILLHEMSHVRRRDNLGTAIHMLVEAVFWFHPLVWFLGTRLMDERERACDEDVVRAGNQPYAYAEGVLKVCELYLQSPLRCMSGVTGSNLTTRIQAILAGHVGCDLSFSKRTILTTAGILALVMPIAIGIIHAAPLQFEVASIKTNPSHGFGNIDFPPNGHVDIVSVTLKGIMQASYGLQGYQIIGGPNWLDTDRFDLQAKPSADYEPKPPTRCFPPNCPLTPIQLMMQDLLRDRFQLRTHRETREFPIYELTIAKSGFKLKEADPGTPVVPSPPPPPGTPPPTNLAALPTLPPGAIGIFGAGLAASSVRISALASALSGILGRPIIDKTGIMGEYDFKFVFSRVGLDGALPAPPAAPARALEASDPMPSIFTAVQEQLGLRLQAAKGPIEVLVIDNASKPIRN